MITELSGTTDLTKAHGCLFVEEKVYSNFTIIEFVEGDPDRPILTGRLYNALNKPPGGLPGTKASTTIRSNSTPGGGGFNEISLADGKGEECFSMHAQKDMTVDVTDGDMTTTVKTGNQTNTVQTGNQEINGASS